MRINRRNKADYLVLLVNGLNIFCWILFVASLIMFHYARPELEYGIVRYFELTVRDSWVAQPKNLLYVILYMCTTLSFIAVVLGKFRNRRSDDGHGFNLLALMVICISFILVISS